MPIRDESATFSRRQFLTFGGVALGAALVPSPLFTLTPQRAVGQSQTTVLLPEFALAPHAADVFSARLAGQLGAQMRVTTVSTGRGLTSQVMAAAKQALADGAHVIAAYINEYDTDDVLALTEAAGAGLVVINHGENMPRTESSSPRFTRASLNKWLTAYENGRYVGKGYRRPVMITSSYESGFDAHYAFRLGFEAEGRDSVELPQFIFRNQAELSSVLAMAQSLNPDLAYAGFDGADYALYERVWTLGTPTLTAGMSDVFGEFTRLADETAHALKRWDGAKFAPEQAQLSTEALAVLTRHTSVMKTGWVHPYLAI